MSSQATAVAGAAEARGATEELGPAIILPPIMRALHGRDIWAAEVPAFWSWAAHLVFGAALGLLFTSVRRRRG